MIVRTEHQRKEVLQRIQKINLDKQAWEITAHPWKAKRSDEQNNLSHMWYAEIGRQSGQTPLQVKNECKFRFGCPILCEVDPAFSEFYDKLIMRYTYEECVAAMEFVDVTSRKTMTVEKMTEYLRHVELFAVEGGYTITKPVDKYHLAMGEQYEQRTGN